MRTEQRLAYEKQYREAHAEKISAYLKDYAEKNKEKLRAYMKAYYKKHCAEIRERTSLRHNTNKSNPQYIATRAEYSKFWVKTPKGRAMQARANARQRMNKDLRKLHKTPPMTAREWQMVQAVHLWACSYCGIREVRLTMDHVVPLSRGGAHDKYNIVPACLPCNSSKKDRLLNEWRRGGSNRHFNF